MQDQAGMEAFINARLLGQEEAVAEFCGVVSRAEHGPKRAGRPRGFVLLLGPTGTGKTEMVKLAAQWLYGGDAEARLRRLDMGEYQHRDSVLRLLGGEGRPALLGRAVDALNERGGGILLLDEIEKAHPDLLTLLLSFDEARTTMADGETKDLSSCYVLMTSNLGAAEAAQMTHNGYAAVRRKVQREAEQVLRKETVARFTAVIVMNTLSYEVQERIAARLLARELLLQSEHCHRWVEVADEGVLSFLVGKGFSRDLGARNIRRTIERHVGDALAPFAALGESSMRGYAELVGDRWSRGLVLKVEGDALVAWPLRRSVALRSLLARVCRDELAGYGVEESPFRESGAEPLREISLSHDPLPCSHECAHT